MKYDRLSNPNRFARRTRRDFTDGLFAMLREKPFEAITVQALCERCGYPRATFYNYFEDIYDLLETCFLTLTEEINLQEYREIPPKARMYVLFERIYDLLEARRSYILDVLRVNPDDGRLLDLFLQFLYRQILALMRECPITGPYSVPYEMLAEHFSNTVALLIKWSCLRDPFAGKKEAVEALRLLLGDLQERLDPGE